MRQNHRQRHHQAQAHRWTQLWVVALMTASVLLGGLSPVAWAQLTPSNILVIDRDAGGGNRGTLFRVNLATGTRTALSTFSNAEQGLLGSQPTGVAIEASGTILVIDGQAGTDSRGALFRVNPADGHRELLSDFGDADPLGRNPTGVAVEAAGTILVIASDGGTSNRGALFWVDPATQTRELINDFGDSMEGPIGADPCGVALETGGTILVIDRTATSGHGALFRVNPVTRTRELINDFDDDKPGPQGEPAGVAVEAAGTILVIDQNAGTNGRGGLFRVDPATNNRDLFSDFGDSMDGPLGFTPTGVAVEATGTILVIDEFVGTNGRGALFRVDPADGARMLLHDFGGAGKGPLGSNPTGIAVLIDDPEPPPPVHDLAVTKITVPQTVTLTATKPQLTKPVTVQLQNRSPHDETIPNLTTLGHVVSLTVTSLGSCPPPDQVLKNPGLPKTLQPKKTLTVVFNVTFECANDPAKGVHHADYSYTATVNHEALDGEADTHPEDDSCPRDPLEGV